ncbi:MAG: hypothetical protein WBG46_07250 [Nonlabens sp.]
MGQNELAKEQYKKGLKKDPASTHLLTDLGTYYLAQSVNGEQNKNLKTALSYLETSYKIDPKDVNTVFKLSVIHGFMNNCAEAWNFYNECKTLGGAPITAAFTKDLEARCPKE